MPHSFPMDRQHLGIIVLGQSLFCCRSTTYIDGYQISKQGLGIVEIIARIEIRNYVPVYIIAILGNFLNQSSRQLDK